MAPEAATRRCGSALTNTAEVRSSASSVVANLCVDESIDRSGDRRSNRGRNSTRPCRGKEQGLGAERRAAAVRDPVGEDRQ
jgi:hypothetical protein